MAHKSFLKCMSIFSYEMYQYFLFFSHVTLSQSTCSEDMIFNVL